MNIDGYYGINNLSLRFSRNLNILVGANGSGKSRVLRAIFEEIKGLPHPGAIEVDLRSDQEDGPDVLYINLSRISEIYKDYFASLDSVTEALLNGVDAANASPEELKEINFILCRNYSSVKFFETEPSLRLADHEESAVFSEEVIPYFEVEEGELAWDTCRMGSGEYAALFLWWTLRSIPEGTIVLLEEPEAFLSYKVQERMADFIVSKVWDLKLFTIISSHAFPFIARTPEKGITPLLRSRSGIKVGEQGRSSILAHIGSPIQVSLVILTEDDFSEFFTSRFISRFFPREHAKIRITKVSGAAPARKSGATGIQGVLDGVRHADNFPLRVAGLYDADQEFESSYTSDNIKHCVKGLLPRSASLDQEFVEICRSNLEDLNGLHPNFENSFISHDGTDFHDMLRNVGADIGIPVSVIWGFCWEKWVAQNSQRVETLKVEISRILSESGLDG